LKNKIKYWLTVIILITGFPFVFHFFIYSIISSQYNYHYWFLAVLGAALAFLLIRFTIIMQYIYIFFHELSHAILVLVFSGEVYEMKIKLEYGYIKSDKNNMLIRLSPFIFPVSLYLLIIIYYLTIIICRYNNIPFRSDYKDIFIIVFFVFFFATMFYNLKLIKKETTDIASKEIFVSLGLILTSFFLNTSALLFLLLKPEQVLQYIYFID